MPINRERNNDESSTSGYKTKYKNIGKGMTDQKGS